MNYIIIYQWRLAMGPGGVQVARCLNKEDADKKVQDLRASRKLESIELHETKCIERWEYKNAGH
jgi:hypothetical protein